MYKGLIWSSCLNIIEKYTERNYTELPGSLTGFRLPKIPVSLFLSSRVAVGVGIRCCFDVIPFKKKGAYRNSGLNIIEKYTERNYTERNSQV